MTMAEIIEGARDKVRAIIREEIRQSRDRRLWNEAETYADLCRLTEQFVRGELSRTPDHYGPRDPETVEIADALAHANHAGYLTVCSQPGEDDFAEWTDEHGGHPTWQQYPAVEGFAPSEVLHRIRSVMPGRITILVQHAPTKSWRTADYRESVIVTLVNGHPHTSFGHRLHRRGIEQTLDGIADRLVQEIALMHQVTLIDKRFGKHTDLWEGLQKL